MREKRLALDFTLKAGDDQGKVEAVFSTFDVIDSDGEVVTRSAITDGQELPMVWHHQWDEPIGKGIVKVDGNRAVFAGDFNLNDPVGKQAYERVKFMGGLQEWSFGFRPSRVEFRDFTMGDAVIRDVPHIVEAELFEVSPVLVGANRNTETLSVKEKRGPVLTTDDLDIFLKDGESLGNAEAIWSVLRTYAESIDASASLDEIERLAKRSAWADRWQAEARLALAAAELEG